MPYALICFPISAYMVCPRTHKLHILNFSDSFRDFSINTSYVKHKQAIIYCLMEHLDYSSDSSSSSSASQSPTTNSPPSKRPRLGTSSTSLPPLPSIITDKYHTAPPTKSSKMRLRYKLLSTVPHGMVNSYTYAEFMPTTSQCLKLHSVVRDVNNILDFAEKVRPGKTKPLFENQLGVKSALHVSLSDNFYLKKAQKESFEKMLKDRVQELPWKGKRDTRLTFNKVRTVPNNTADALFVVLTLDEESKERIRPLFELVKTVAEEARQGDKKVFAGPELNELDALHVSFAASDKISYKMDDLEELNELCELLDPIGDLEFEFDALKIVAQQGRFGIKLF